MNKLTTMAIGSLLLISGNAQAVFFHIGSGSIDGSLCVGFDCVSSESFGFDTIKIKENNLRIKFDDTSVAASFPRNDWQLTANASANGGLEKFSIDDISGGRTPFTVEAGARTNALYVENSGEVGIGTSNPATDIHIKSGDTPTLRLEQDGTSGFTPQIWDVAGNETNFFIRDATNGSRLPFKIRPSAPTNSIFIDSDGDIGIGTSSPADDGFSDRLLEVKDNDSVRVSIDFGNGAGEFGEFAFEENNIPKWSFGSVSSNDRFYIYNYNDNSEDFTIDTNGDIGLGGVTNPGSPIEHSNGATLSAGGSWLNGSSRSFKKDIEILASDQAMSALFELQPVSFRYKTEPEELYVGFIAEEVPELVASNSRTNLSSMDIVAVLTSVVQTQQQAIQKLEQKIAHLEKRDKD